MMSIRRWKWERLGLSRADARYETVDRLKGAIDNLMEGFQIIDRQWRYLYLNKQAALHGRSTVDNLIRRTMMECYPGVESTEMFSALRRCMNGREPQRFENLFTYPDGKSAWFELSVEPMESGICVLSIDITERKQTEAQLDLRLAELEAVNRVSSSMRTARNLDEMMRILLDETLSVLHLPFGAIWLFDPASAALHPAVLRGYDEERRRPAPRSERPGEGFAGRAFASGRPEISNDLHADERLPESVRQGIPAGTAAVAIAIRSSDDTIGAFTVCDEKPRLFTHFELDLLSTLSEMAGNAIQRMRLHEETERRFHHLSSLREIDLAITTSFDLSRNLRTILEKVTRELQVDAADVLLLGKGSSRLRFGASYGFNTKEIEKSNLRIGEGEAGRSVAERAMVHIPELGRSPGFARSELIAAEGFVSYYGAPLITRGEVCGVLELFHRAPLDRDHEWVDLFEALAGQTAIAVEVSTLFDSLQRSSNDLSLAYDATIEGWSRALDLRDKETEGHTRRVTDLTVRLAQAAGFSDNELVYVRWGALLHDIGKMGVPDSILLKPGPLTEEEWVLMRRHPTLAFEMLAPIQYLKSSIDIPYCHHEKWDGSGYPRGLKGEMIPLSARLFAVVDVWDALRSDRPYRPGWSEERVREHIRSLAGSHFDPNAVRIFLQVTDPRT